MPRRDKGQRKQEILQVLALELETNPGSRITTASLAKAVGVSEAALYRHFASKAKMFEALIDFAEESVFGLINQVMEKDKSADIRCEKILTIMLGFAEKNPGISRVLIGDALVGENERLRKRVCQFLDRVETQLKQVLREANLTNGVRARAGIDSSAALMMNSIEGAISAYIRSDFTRIPTSHWPEQWPLLAASIFIQPI